MKQETNGPGKCIGKLGARNSPHLGNCHIQTKWIALHRGCLLLPCWRQTQGWCLEEGDMPTQAPRRVFSCGCAVPSTVWMSLSKWGWAHRVQQRLGSASTAADRQRHICDLFLVLTRIPCMKSFNFWFLFLEMRLMIIPGSPIQRRGNFSNACKILQKAAWGWARAISPISCALTCSLSSQVCFQLRSGAAGAKKLCWKCFCSAHPDCSGISLGLK